MKVKVYPGFAQGQIQVPPSKSLLHRAIICASLAKGTSAIKNIVYSEDIKATINAFKKLGVKIIKEENSLKVIGSGELIFLENETIDCNESGSTIRFLIPLITNSSGIYITGTKSLLNRPMSIYEDIFKDNDLVFKREENRIFLKGDLPAQKYVVKGNISSQFISGLLFTLPLKKEDSEIQIIGDFESKKYVDMTLEVLKCFGINIIEQDNIYYIQGNQSYRPTDYKVESDYSQLAFFAVAGIINGDIKITNLNPFSLQPDASIIDVIKKMNGKVSKEKHSLRFTKSNTTNIDLDVSQFPDIAPILSILAGLSQGECLIYNAKRLKIKETDRLQAINDILKKLGVRTDVYEESYRIYGQEAYQANVFDSYNDHRMVMSIAIAALRSNNPVIIENYEAVNKSYPHFFEDLQSLGIKIEYI